MRVLKGDIWKLWDNDSVIVIPTNGVIKENSSLVMGKGLALQAKNRIHCIEYMVGSEVKRNGNNVYYFAVAGIITFPVKHNWKDKADLKLIERSAKQLQELIDFYSKLPRGFANVVMPKVGCGAGGLSWGDVEPILDKYLSYRAIVIDLK